MTPRERWLAALRLQPVDRLPFWPKLDGSYPRAQNAPFRDMEPDAIHDWIGSDKHEWGGSCVREVRRRTSIETAENNGVQVTRFKTPSGTLERVNRFDAGSQSWHPVKFPVAELDDIKVMIEWYADCEVELDEDGLEKARDQAKATGSTAVTAVGIGESPLMHWVEWIAGVENAHLLLADHTDEVEALFGAIHCGLLRRTEIESEHSPCDLLYMGENTSTTLISPEQYRKYCYRHIGEYARITSGAGRLMVLHMCGHLKALLPMLAELPVAAFEAFTSPTLGNTMLLDGRTACPDQCLIGGTNATLWTRPADEIIRQIRRDLDALPHHRGIVVTSAGVMPPLCEPETIRTVCNWVKDYEPRFM